MIKIKKLKELIKDIPDDAICWAYSGEVTGISIRKDMRGWFIGCGEGKDEDTFIEGFEFETKTKETEEMKAVIRYLMPKLYTEGNKSERLNSSNFEDNDHYKVTYRFLANMLGGNWEKRFTSFPTLDEAKAIAKKVNPYFEWLLNNEKEGWVFSNNYEYVTDAWR
jgi:hypothetical protein